ncbi:hypothetical protein [Parageobacillus thermoglucosidasius]|uniref:hypothetical protein n=1 Tax=Parageobacillus thermoglucosidasius TaxID=1426 RepID=UPI000B558765|nr:hypothetical protein [Parageobacillus thermoglucosidasius]MBY6270084.1 hypothetical protein [Parageobacillus thermoglucosidasius]OUM84583.1 MAG: hypothetical protein BAA00_02995 [Parageobacillus thermoglucosidasius]
METVIIKKDENGKRIAEFNINYPIEDFQELFTDIKNCTDLLLIATDEKREGQKTIHYFSYYLDHKGQITLRITDNQYMIDFNDFITLTNLHKDENIYRLLDDALVDEIVIQLVSKTRNNIYETEYYHIVFTGLRRYFVMEKLSKYKINKILKGEREIKYKEITL